MCCKEMFNNRKINQKSFDEFDLKSFSDHIRQNKNNKKETRNKKNIGLRKSK